MENLSEQIISKVLQSVTDIPKYVRKDTKTIKWSQNSAEKKHHKDQKTIKEHTNESKSNMIILKQTTYNLNAGHADIYTLTSQNHVESNKERHRMFVVSANFIIHIFIYCSALKTQFYPPFR